MEWLSTVLLAEAPPDVDFVSLAESLADGQCLQIHTASGDEAAVGQVIVDGSIQWLDGLFIY